jgi:hypothetical protein
MKDKRHIDRYFRRLKKREKRKELLRSQYANPEIVFSTASIVAGYKKTSKQSRWKSSTQSFGANLFVNAEKESSDLLNREWHPKGFHEFDIVERGKHRHIKSVHISEKCVQAALCNECLIPIIKPSLVFNNGACLPGKGTDFSLNRLTCDLRWHYQHFGLSGGIFVFDFHSYFDNIPHKSVKDLVFNAVKEKTICDVYNQCIDAFSLETDEQLGLGLGSQVSQITAIAYPSKAIDHWIKDELGIHGFGRYNDDGYIICENIDRLEHIKNEFVKRAASLGITMNPKKCRIIKFGEQFEFLKVRFSVCRTGRVVRKQNRKSITKEHGKLRKLKEMMIHGQKPYAEIHIEFNSWLCSQNKGKGFHLTVNMIMYFDALFFEQGGYTPPTKWKRRQNKRYRMIRYAKKVAEYKERYTECKDST